jgi:hypothetical protein
LATESGVGSTDRPKWIEFLLAFDLDYRKRRLRFLIEGQNRLYQMIGSRGLQALDPSAVDRLKRHFYECVDKLEQLETQLLLNPTICGLVEDIFRVAPSPAEYRSLAAYAEAFAETHHEKLDQLVERLGATIDLASSTQDIDVLLGKTAGWPEPGLREVLVNYLGFPFWDVLTFPILPWREAGEFNEIQVDRISAQDARALQQLGAFSLKGAALNNFAAFLSRSYRENDYLLGRLHAIDRLIDVVGDSAGVDPRTSESLVSLKRKAFLTVLDAEESDLSACAGLIAELRNALRRSASAR